MSMVIPGITSGNEEVTDGPRIPVDRVAARVVKWKGEHFDSRKRICNVDTQRPLPILPPAQVAHSLLALYGVRFGRLTVVGASELRDSRVVCRCDCGRYCIRRSNAVRNPNNQIDRCEECRHLAYLKEHDRWKRNKNEPGWTVSERPQKGVSA